MPTRSYLPNFLPALLMLAAPLPTLAGLYETGGTGIGTSPALEASAQWRDSDSKRSLVLPNIEFIVPVTTHMEVSVETGYSWVNLNGSEHNGLRDVEMAAKWRFVDEDTAGWRPAMVIKPTFMIPTGDDERGLGDGIRQLHLPLALSKQIGRLGIGAEVTYARLFGRDDEDKIYLSGLVQWSLSDTVKIGAELGGDTLADDTGKFHWRGNVGVKWKASPTVELQGMFGKTIEHRRGEAVNVAKFLLAYKL
jgi:hypothetical protein